ncbi:hypothetical protein TCAL_08075 [Tigriopus californicus]|uniref:MH2 domain-containing protein n=1 Tax=Tigriopus californicus TaxID=6832 RepID=A0A553NSC2_TIGCA|nr:hypothetical protein TCAL_08075 [Tigriopus californicus]
MPRKLLLYKRLSEETSDSRGRHSWNSSSLEDSDSDTSGKSYLRHSETNSTVIETSGSGSEDSSSLSSDSVHCLDHDRPREPLHHHHNLRNRSRRATNDGLSWSQRKFWKATQKQDDLESSRPWCRLAYWECKDRRGEPFPVISNSVDVFTHLPKGSGLCLENVFGQSPIPKDKAVLKTRQKIGQGILLSHEDSTGQVWVYNRTRDAIFVHSPTLDPPAPRMDVVHKIMPGRSAQIFDYEKSWIFQRDRDPRDFPMDPYSVQISFVKGWGREYKRPDVLLCPCWLEIRMERRTKR